MASVLQARPLVDPIAEVLEHFGERRVTDHRIKLTVYNLDQVLEGQLEELTAALQADEKRRRLQAQAAA